MNRKLTLAVLALAPLLAFGATPSPKPDSKAGDQASAPGEPPPGDEGDLALPPAKPEGGAAAGERGGTAPPDTYTIRPGDTLWDLAGRFLNNPWYWPKVWSYNPEITNPHWIDPGNLLRFYPSGEEGPARVTPAEAVAQEEVPEEAEPVRELEDLAKTNTAGPASEEEKETVAVAGPYKIGFVAPRTAFARRDAFVTPHELDESGTIRAAFEEKTLLTLLDRPYATFRKSATVKAGETYSIYRTIRKVKHPVTGDTLGYETVILGAARVIALDDRAVKLSITAAYEPIERGDFLGPWSERPYRAVPAKRNGKNLRGYVVGTPLETLSQLAESHVVFVDLGRAEGVEEGNRFVVVRAGDPVGAPGQLPRWDNSLPTEDVGLLLVVDVKEHASAALVTRSIFELAPGDRVEMRASQ
jgi:hypothetical protein